MRIAFVYDIPYPWHKGGIEQIFGHESRELAKAGLDVHFFTLRWRGMLHRFSYQNVEYHALGRAYEHTVYRHGRRSIREALFFALRSLELFGHSFNAVITDAFPILHLPIVRAYCRLRGCRLIIRVDEVWNKKYWSEYLGIFGFIASAYSNAALICKNATYVANSEEIAARLEALGIQKRQIRIFAPIIDGEEIRSAIAANKRQRGSVKRVIFAGRLIKEKRLDKWLGIVRKAADIDNGIKALIIGEGVERQKAEALIRRLRLSGRVELRPFYKDKAKLYREIIRSRAVLHTSEREGLGIIVLESLALGTPVVLSESSPIPNSIKRMCSIGNEKSMPSLLLKAIKGRRRRIRKDLDTFSSSGVIHFYRNIGVIR